MAVVRSCGFFLTVLVVFAVTLKCDAAEIISSEELLLAIENDPPRELPIYFSVPPYYTQKDYSKRSNLNKFKNLMITKDDKIMVPLEDDRDENQLFYIPRINHASGKRGAILSWAIPGNRRQGSSSNYRQATSSNINRPAAAA